MARGVKQVNVSFSGAVFVGKNPSDRCSMIYRTIEQANEQCKHSFQTSYQFDSPPTIAILFLHRTKVIRCLLEFSLPLGLSITTLLPQVQ